MKTALIRDIHIAPNRQRRNFDLKSLNELGESIAANGLLHPIVVREDAGQLFLVAGERRLRAMIDLHELDAAFSHDGEPVPANMIPYVTLGELDELAREEAEWEENFRRVNLTWQEQAEASRRLSELRKRQAAAKGLTPPTVADIARELRPEFTENLADGELGKHQNQTRKEIIVANHLADPEIKAAKSVDEAFKLLKRKEEAKRRVELAAKVGRTYSAATAHRAINDQFQIWAKGQAANSFDVILTDPPYGIGADEFGDSGGKAAGAHFYEDDYAYWKEIIEVFASESFRLAKEKAHLYAFCDITRFEELKAILCRAGWNCFRTPIIWHKPNGSRTPWVDSGPQRKYELILYANKGKKPVTRIFPDLVSYPTDENLGHPAQKPVALYEDLLRRSVSAGDSVADFFCGSGPIFPAATRVKCLATGIEANPAAYGICLKRLDSLQAEPELAGL